MKTPLRLLIFLLTLVASGAGIAQWQWVDKDGRKVFSDRSPPPDIPEKDILKRPGKVAVDTAPKDESTASDGGFASPVLPASGAKAGGLDKELEAKKKQLAQAEAEKRKADQERIAKAKAENCTRAQQSKATFESNVRITKTNAAGEREFLDEAARAEELQRIQQIIARDCKR